MLAKRRWRGTAGDGREFGFDLDRPLGQGDCFYVDEHARYVLEQTAEQVLEIVITEPESAARIAWTLGNLHMAVQILPKAVRVVDDPAVRNALVTGGIAFQEKRDVLLPLSISVHHHGHSHG